MPACCLCSCSGPVTPLHPTNIKHGRVQINCDGEPMNEKKYRFGVLPKRLRVHMPMARLLKDNPESEHQGTQSYQKRIASPKKRPPPKEARAAPPCDLSWLALNAISA